jgi:hypothetical protein
MGGIMLQSASGESEGIYIGQYHYNGPEYEKSIKLKEKYGMPSVLSYLPEVHEIHLNPILANYIRIRYKKHLWQLRCNQDNCEIVKKSSEETR